MTKKKQPVTKEEILQIEKYIYELQKFCTIAEIVKDASIEQLKSLYREIEYMRMALSIYKKLYPKEKPVIGWCLDEIKDGHNYIKYDVFSSAESAGYILREVPSKITAMCKGTRSTPLIKRALPEPVKTGNNQIRLISKGWKFVYKEDFDKNPDNRELVFDPGDSFFKFKTVNYSEKG